jgi:hypothetical protein
LGASARWCGQRARFALTFFVAALDHDPGRGCRVSTADQHRARWEAPQDVDFGQAGTRAVRFNCAISEENNLETARRLGEYLGRKRQNFVRSC